ncbi:hypothetical protein OSB04_023046 [Centaurea solstitialis]|uniref:Non-specific lipid-transfer protein n=1 Tax=Centaurea solstitialis TaxID=347529 RepID=A0AA38SK31_9ASTR|nr:hypothetical protein OSB04_023046 [Centaurea solstitialis]
MAGGMLMKMACVVLACMVVFAPPTEANIIKCGQVLSSLLPCLSYLRSGGALGSCCNGVRALNNAARTTANRKIACGCLKDAYSSFPGIDPSSAAGLPAKCGVNIPYNIVRPNTDCSKIH